MSAYHHYLHLQLWLVGSLGYKGLLRICPTYLCILLTHSLGEDPRMCVIKHNNNVLWRLSAMVLHNFYIIEENHVCSVLA